MKTLVSGGAGFIGSHLCEALLQAGHTVVCVDNLITGSQQNITPLLNHPNFISLFQDVNDPFDLEVDAIFHLASLASPVSYWTLPFETIKVNTQGTWNLLEIARKHQSKFLMASTSEIYGNPEIHPQPESYLGNVSTTGNRACYDESKRLGETLTMEYWRQYHVDVRITRLFNTYGPRSQLNDGRLIPNFITQSLLDNPLVIHGTGLQTRSLSFVDDIVQGLLLAMFMPDTNGEVFNLGNPEEMTILEWARKIIDLCNASSVLLFEAKRDDDPERRRPNINKAQRILGWNPQIDSTVGLTRTIAWFRQVMAIAPAKTPIEVAGRILHQHPAAG